MDLSKAIDAIDRNLLWAILYEKGPPWDCIRLIRMGHTNNQLRPNYKGALGNSTHNNRGVFQGSHLSEMLSIAYFDRMMRDYTQNLNGEMNIGNTHYYNVHLNRNTHGPTTSERRNSETRKLHAPTTTRTYTKQLSNRAINTFTLMT